MVVKRKKKRNIKTFYILLVVCLFLLTCYQSFFGKYSIFKYFEYQEKEKQLILEQQELRQKIEIQKKNNKLLENGDAYEIEKQARKRGMAKKGEKVYKFEIKKGN